MESYSIGYCQQCPNKVQWPAETGPSPPLYFNAGMFIFEPSRLTYVHLRPFNTLLQSKIS
uniref:Hexosyltransferase n=1 Tax=Manihot esculenta TaxID=3983 RepID=A0A2C9UT72_MANES